jgi:hypothetical protein
MITRVLQKWTNGYWCNDQNKNTLEVVRGLWHFSKYNICTDAAHHKLYELGVLLTLLCSITCHPRADKRKIASVDCLIAVRMDRKSLQPVVMCSYV